MSASNLSVRAKLVAGSNDSVDRRKVQEEGDDTETHDTEVRSVQRVHIAQGMQIQHAICSQPAQTRCLTGGRDAFQPGTFLSLSLWL